MGAPSALARDTAAARAPWRRDLDGPKAPASDLPCARAKECDADSIAGSARGWWHQDPLL